MRDQFIPLLKKIKKLKALSDNSKVRIAHIINLFEAIQYLELRHTSGSDSTVVRHLNQIITELDNLGEGLLANELRLESINL